MEKITQSVYSLEHLKLSNIYLVKQEGLFTLIDTGMAVDADTVISELEAEDIKIGQIKRIIITHSHMDHTGGLKTLSELSGAQVYVHQADFDEIKDKVSAGKLNALKDKDIIDMLGKTEVIHIPGHTKGTIALYQENDRILFSGDCLFNNSNLSLPPENYNYDTAHFKRNVTKLLGYDVHIICPGHGGCIKEGCNGKIRMVIEKR